MSELSGGGQRMRGFNDATDWLLDRDDVDPFDVKLARYYKPPDAAPDCVGCNSTGYNPDTCQRCAYDLGFDDGASK